jgi:hypothetical protein
MSRENALASEHQKTKSGSSGKFYYVSVATLERQGIAEFRTPQPGDYFIRIISPRFSKCSPENLPFYGREIFKHDDIGADQRTFLCRKKMWGEPCPVCELAEKLRQTNPEDDQVAALRWSRRYLFFVYDVKNTESEAKGLNWYDCPVTIKDDIISLSKDKRTGKFIDVSDRVEGKDIEFTKTGTGMQGTKYGGTKLVDNAVPPEDWYANVPDDFEEFLLHPTYEEVQREVTGLIPSSETQQNTAAGVVQDPPIAAPSVRTRGGVNPATMPPSATPTTPSVSESGVPNSATTASTRTRGNPSAAGSIDPQVRSRIEQLKRGG